MQQGSVRQLRAVTLSSVSLVLVAIAAAAYLGPVVLRPRVDPLASPPISRWHLTSAAFGDADHSAVSMIRTTGDGQPISDRFATVATYLTSDGARTWRRLWPGVAFTSFLDRDYVVISYLDRRSFDITADAGRIWTSVAWPEGSGAVGEVRIGPMVLGMGLAA